jgi:integrase
MEYLDLKYFDRKTVIAFVTYLADTHKYSKVTIKKYIQVLRWYFDFEVDRKTIAENPVKRIPNIGRVVDDAAVPFTDKERKTLKDCIKPACPQLWLACELMFYCAIRPGTEIRLMQVGDIDIARKQIRVPATTAKNNTTEFVDIPDIMINSLNEWNLSVYPSDFYLLGKSGKPDRNHWGKNHFRFEFNKYRKLCAIPDNRKFYSWKHTGAITIIQNGAKPYDLMEHLRHKNFATTEKYIKKRTKLPERRVNQFIDEI